MRWWEDLRRALVLPHAVGVGHDDRSSRGVPGGNSGELLGPTSAALDPEAPYVVEWRDAYFFGSQGFGLLGELDHAGFDVGATEFNLVPAT